MPVPHGHETPRVYSLISQFSLKGARLALRVRQNRGSSPNGRVVMLHFACASGRDQFGQRFSPEAGEGKVNNIGVAKEVVQKRFDCFQLVGSTELKENYPHTPCCARHSPEIPRTRQCTPNRACESMAESQAFASRRECD